MKEAIENFKKDFEGNVLDARFWRESYSTDASIYKLVPEMVVLPKTKEDIKKTVKFAKEHKVGITCRTAGTSLAGTSVGKGIIMDFTFWYDNLIKNNLTRINR